MSRLLAPTLGDYLDRWCVLELKILHAREAGHAPATWAHFTREQALIRQHPGVEALLGTPAAQQLFAVNAAIWAHTDRLLAAQRVWPAVSEAAVYEIADTGMQILSLNERRAALVQAIESDRPAEKLRG